MFHLQSVLVTRKPPTTFKLHKSKTPINLSSAMIFNPMFLYAKMYFDLFNIALVQLICLFVCFVALRPKSTAMVIAGRSVYLTTHCFNWQLIIIIVLGKRMHLITDFFVPFYVQPHLCNCHSAMACVSNLFNHSF